MMNPLVRKLDALTRAYSLLRPIKRFFGRMQHAATYAQPTWVTARPPVYSLIPRESAANQPFMPYSTCSAGDFFHPRFAELSAMMNTPLLFHRKYWEWVYILNTALNRGINSPGKRALGFGVGQEPIPAALATLGVTVTATDAPSEIGVGQGWNGGGQYAGSAQQLNYEGILDQDRFAQLVSYRVADMNALSSDLTGYDFCWSSCALEHLGTLRHGIDFILNSVEQTLKPGGIACHTTELNLSSNEDTVTEGPTVIYRRRDIDDLLDELRRRGHEVEAVRIAPDGHELDRYVDIPPFSPHGHLKLSLEGYVATSLALTIRRAPV